MSADTATLGGEPWRRLADLPRPVAESYRRALAAAGVPSVLRTPFQWVLEASVVEIEGGSFWGVVGLYVPEVRLAAAEAVVRALEGE